MSDLAKTLHRPAMQPPFFCGRCQGRKFLDAQLQPGSLLLEKSARAGRLAHQLRREMEILRKHARHGTRRTLSRLFVALLVVTDPLLLSLSTLTQMIKDCLLDLRCGQATKVAVQVVL
jgi:hypothetical protein